MAHVTHANRPNQSFPRPGAGVPSKRRSFIVGALCLISLQATAADCGDIRINASNSDGYVSHARCAKDRQLVGSGDITVQAGGYLELIRIGTTTLASSRVRCENNTGKQIKLNLSTAQEWRTLISASGCIWRDEKMVCGTAPDMICLIEVMRPVKQTLAIYAMVQVKEPLFDRDQSELDRLRNWLQSQNGAIDYCRQRAAMDWPVDFALVVAKSGKLTFTSASVPDAAHTEFARCVSRRLDTAGLSGLAQNYSVDWRIEAP